LRGSDEDSEKPERRPRKNLPPQMFGSNKHLNFDLVNRVGGWLALLAVQAREGCHP